MEIQSLLTLAIELIFMTFVALMVCDLTNGLFQVFVFEQFTFQSELPKSSVIAPEQISNPQQSQVSSQNIAQAAQFEQLPDPWTLQSESQTPRGEIELLVQPFPTLRLLPPASSVKTKRTPTKKAKATSTTTPKSAGAKSTRKPNSSRKNAA